MAFLLEGNTLERDYDPLVDDHLVHKSMKHIYIHCPSIQVELSSQRGVILQRYYGSTSSYSAFSLKGYMIQKTVVLYLNQGSYCFTRRPFGCLVGRRPLLPLLLLFLICLRPLSCALGGAAVYTVLRCTATEFRIALTSVFRLRLSVGLDPK